MGKCNQSLSMIHTESTPPSADMESNAWGLCKPTRYQNPDDRQPELITSRLPINGTGQHRSRTTARNKLNSMYPGVQPRPKRRTHQVRSSLQLAYFQYSHYQRISDLVHCLLLDTLEGNRRAHRGISYHNTRSIILEIIYEVKEEEVLRSSMKIINSIHLLNYDPKHPPTAEIAKSGVAPTAKVQF